MGGLYPATRPYARGMLDVGDGNQVYWEACGKPDGKPAVIVHGGPGSGCKPGQGRAFDPERYRLVLFDQRGCGRSRPHASDPATDMRDNTTAHLIADMELLREHLGIDRWLLYGYSWGSTLSLAYAERYPERVARRLAGIPGVLIHGRLDMGGPLDTAWRLARAWPDAQLRVVDNAGHLGNNSQISHVIDALDQFAGR